VKPAAVRKQAGDLRPADLERFPIWEFAIDEEGLPGQDEETVRPRPDLDRGDPSEGLLLVRAEFVAADGTAFTGFVTPATEPRISELQPTIVTDGGHVTFWFGIVPPRPGQIESSYRLLGKDAGTLFPLRFTSGEQSGEVEGFQHYESLELDRVVVLT
jgi:hypothetical protein